jgi:hypothetical protein
MKHLYNTARTSAGETKSVRAQAWSGGWQPSRRGRGNMKWQRAGWRGERQENESDRLCRPCSVWVGGGGGVGWAVEGFDVSKKGPANRKACLFQEAEFESRGLWRAALEPLRWRRSTCLCCPLQGGWEVCSGTDQGSAPAPPSSSLHGSRPCPVHRPPSHGGRAPAKEVHRAELNFLLCLPARRPGGRNLHSATGAMQQKGKGGLAIFVGIFSQGVPLGSLGSRGGPAPWGEPWETSL